MQLAPIPPYGVYDGMEQEIDAALVLERVLSTSDTSASYFDHLTAFLRACITLHNSGDNNPYLMSSDLSNVPSLPARQWAKDRFQKCFPALTAPVSIIPTVATLPEAESAATISTIGKSQPTATVADPESADKAKGISKCKLSTTLLMCGKPMGGKL